MTDITDEQTNRLAALQCADASEGPPGFMVSERKGV